MTNEMINRITLDPYNIFMCYFNWASLKKDYNDRIIDNWQTDIKIQKLFKQRVNFETLYFEESKGKDFSIVYERYDTRCVVSISMQSGKNIYVNISSDNVEYCRNELVYLKKLFTPIKVNNDQISVKFWFYNEGASSYTRKLVVPGWKDININYPYEVYTDLESLIKHKPNDNDGKMILWRGNPGTGKTYALRALAREWQSWCNINYIMDPEIFLSEGSYLLETLLGNEEYKYNENDLRITDDNKKWNLIILEDTGELLSKDAMDREGQKLSRLLNICDGLLGQGLRCLFLITTNEELGSLHSAVRRPGRCLSEIKFDTFTKEEANKWLMQNNYKCAINHSCTLAELYAIIKGENSREEKAFGFDVT